MVNTGIKFLMPKRIYAKICLKKELTSKNIEMWNIEEGPDIISSAFTNIYKVKLINNGNEEFSFKKGDPLAEAIFLHLDQFDLWMEYDLYKVKDRVTGLGSTDFNNISLNVNLKYFE